VHRGHLGHIVVLVLGTASSTERHIACLRLLSNLILYLRL
jgi:hypothetical protein